MPLPHWLTRVNLVVTNRITQPIACRLPWFGLLEQVGRRSGTVRRTPLNIFRRGDSYVIALTYGPDVQWLKNVQAAGGCRVCMLGRWVPLTSPRRFRDRAVARSRSSFAGPSGCSTWTSSSSSAAPRVSMIAMRTGWIALCLCLLSVTAGCGAPAQTPDSGAPSDTPGPSGLRAACVGVAAEGEPLEIEIEADGDDFSTDHITGPRHCQPFVIVFTNSDPIQHNVAISTEELGQGESLLFGERITGPETIRYEVAGIPAGDYFFVCTPHWQSMNGRLTVTAA